MSQEIIEGIRAIEKEKGIETGTLIAALEDALLAAYKKTPGAARHATVELDDEGEFKVFSIEIPGDLEVRLLDEAREKAIDVSSPGPDRPLRRPEHFRKAVGGTVKLRTEDAQKIRGTLLAADENAVTVAVNGTNHQIPVDEIVRGNLIAEGEKA